MGMAIFTKFRGPTNRQGSRYSASAGGLPDGKSDRLTMQSDQRLNPTKNRAMVAKALATKLEWDGLWIAGGVDGSDIVYVRAPVAHIHAQDMARYMPAAFEGEDWFFVPEKAPE